MRPLSPRRGPQLKLELAGPCVILRAVKLVLHWFRRDLRVTDNTALSEAARRGERVLPVFILEDALHTGPDVGAARLAFLLQSAEELRRDLARLGYPLIVHRGRSEIELPKLCAEMGATAVFCNQRYEPYAQARDARVFNALNAQGVGFEVFKDAVLWEEREILTQAGNPYTVFTPYAKAWRARAIPPPRPDLKAVGPPLNPAAGIAVPRDPADFGHPLSQTVPPAGAAAAHRAWESFLAARVYGYATGRDFPAQAGTSRLSPHLRAGTIGLRTVLAGWLAARKQAGADAAGRSGCDTYLNELIWREFYLQVLANFPHVMRGCFRPEYDALAWPGEEAHFTAWCEGRTGYPIVDAAMRCLNATGGMHNRLRMIVAMFLTKDLLISWQRGERYFMRQLVDGDLAANNGGWQWSAGTGTDAAPYFRIFNPVTQGEKFDPDGAFVRQWVPELATVAKDHIHAPWEAGLLSGARNYPPPIVNHAVQRERCLAMFKAVRAPG